MIKESVILVVDDDPLNIKLLINILKSENEVLFALDGEKAIALSEAQQPDIILLDINMPGLSGYDTCLKLKETAATKEIPVIFISSLTDHEDEDKGLRCGAIDYITKPIRAPIVKSRIKNHLELKHARDVLQQQASLDSLTGIANRRSFDQFILKSWRDMNREHNPLSIIMIDIDYFKSYNDFYGHLGGDECLRKIASIMQNVISGPSHLLARYGGEEFVCVLPSTNAKVAAQIAENLRSDVESLAIPHVESKIHNVVTISLGIASARPDDQLLENFISAADNALYIAKKSGRNKVSS